MNQKKPVGLIYDHMCWHVKYNRKVLIHNIAVRCEEIIKEVLNNIGCECVIVNVQPNHVHVLVGIPHDKAPSWVTMKMKATSSYLLRREFPILVQQIKKVLWAPSCMHMSVGNNIDSVYYYIKQQDKHHADDENKRGKKRYGRKKWGGRK